MCRLGSRSMSRPNVLLILADQHRPDWIGYGGDVPVRTPNLDELVDNGIAFRNAITPSPVCGPARSCLASGLEYDRCYVRDHHAGQDYPLAAPTLYGRLRDQGGYHTIATGKFDLQKYSKDWGIDGTRYLKANGFSAGLNCEANHVPEGVEDPYTAYLNSECLLDDYAKDQWRRRDTHLRYQEGRGSSMTFPTPLPDHAYEDNFIGRRSLDLLDEAPDDCSWFMQVNFIKPHDPWDVTETMHGWYRDPDVDFPAPLNPSYRLDSTTHQEIRRNYAAMVENIDQWVGRFLTTLEERGELDNTIIIYGADHGESLGDRGSWWKRTPYRESVGIPLMVSGPGVNERGVVDVPTTLLDLHQTILDYADVSVSGIQSQSMRPYITGENDEPPRDTVFSGVGPWRLAFDGRYKLVRGFNPYRHHNKQVSEFDSYKETAVRRSLENRDPLLFDLKEDPKERENRYDDLPDISATLEKELQGLRGN